MNHLEGVQIKQAEESKYLGPIVKEENVVSSIESASRIDQTTSLISQIATMEKKRHHHGHQDLPVSNANPASTSVWIRKVDSARGRLDGLT